MTEDPRDRAPSAYTYPLLIKQLLHTPLANAPRREIVYRDRVRYDYLTLRRRIGQLAAGLESLGVAPGDTVAVLDWDSHRYLECFFAVPMMGAVLHSVNVRLSPQQILYTINHAHDDLILVHEDFLPLLEPIRAEMRTVKRFVLISESDTPPAAGIEFAACYEPLLAASDGAYEFPDFDENTRATTFYTTGTTGDPKGVYYSHRQLVLHTLGKLAGIGISSEQGRFHRDDVYMPITPMFHVHAWGFPYVATLMGVKQVYPGRYTADVLLELLQREKVTFSHCVPTILHMLLTSPGVERAELSGWKVIVGGSALPQGLARRALELGIDVFTGYGMSETGPVLTTAHLDASDLAQPVEAQLERRCKTGRALPLVELRLVDEDMNDVARDGESVGEIVVRAPWLTQGYVDNAEGSAALWRGGYLHTGDMAHIDVRGYVKITDRAKDVIKSGGEWISSLALENIVSQHPAVDEAAAIGIADERWGERPLVLVVLRQDYAGTVCEEDLIAHVAGFVERGELSKFGVPDRVLLVASIDKTSVGKIDKKRLRIKYARP